MKRNAPGVEIRMAKPNDAPFIASVLHQSFAEYESLYTAAGFSTTTSTQDQILSRMNEGPVWVAIQDGTIVGTVSAVPRGEALYIRGMAVLPSARGVGIGARLLRQIETFATEHGYQRLFLSTTPFLSRAIHLYQSYGFERSEEGPDQLHGTPLFTMVKFLRPSAVIREVKAGDAAPIAALLTELGYPTTTEAMARRLGPILADPDYRTWVAAVTDSIVGLIGIRTGHLYESDGLFGQIMVLIVSQQYQGQGIGSALVRQAERSLIKMGARSIIVHSGTHRHGAHAFYEHLGYLHTARRYKKALESRG